MKNGPGVMQRYQGYTSNLHRNFMAYLNSMNHPKVDALETLQMTRLEMKWQTRNATENSGVFAMRHLESYMGEGHGGWDSELSIEGPLQRRQLSRLRSIYLHEIVTSGINELALDNIEKLEAYHKMKIAKLKEEELKTRGVNVNMAKGGKLGKKVSMK